ARLERTSRREEPPYVLCFRGYHPPQPAPDRRFGRGGPHPAPAGGPSVSVAATRRNVVGMVLALGSALALISLGALTLGAVHLSLGEVWSGLREAGSRAEPAIIVQQSRPPR